MKNFFNFGRKNIIEFISLIPELDEELLYPPIESSISEPRKWQIKRAKALKKTRTEKKCPFLSKNPYIMDVVRCPGIKSYINSGYSIRIWSDLYIDLPENPSSPTELKYDFGFNLKNSLPAESKKFVVLNTHKKNDFPELFENDRIYDYIIKIRMPWKIKCSTNVGFYFLPDYYSDDPWFAMTPGILDPAIQDEIIVNLQIFKRQGRIIFNKGMTLGKMIPFEKDKKYKILTRKSKDTDNNKLYNKCVVLNSSFQRNYAAIKEFGSKNNL